MGVDNWTSCHRFACLVLSSRSSAADGSAGHRFPDSCRNADFTNRDVMGWVRKGAAGWERIWLANLDISLWMRCAVFGAGNPMDCLFLRHASSTRLATARNLVSCFQSGFVACRYVRCKIGAVSVDLRRSHHGRPRCYHSCGNLVRCAEGGTSITGYH